MMGRLLCALGLHRWERAHAWNGRYWQRVYPLPDTRWCERCGETQVRERGRWR